MRVLKIMVLRVRDIKLFFCVACDYYKILYNSFF